ncbi:MAG: hypothetical protein PHH36_08945 [Sideroxydans sp.]|nr:hypothetical protein [Sideroxydans sp.]
MNRAIKDLSAFPKTIILFLVAIVSGCASTSDVYVAVKPMIDRCDEQYFSTDRVCVRNIPSHARNRNGEGASDIPASAIISGMDAITTIDANAPYYDDIIAAAQKAIKNTGSAWVLIDYGAPNAYFLSFLNYPEKRSLRVDSAATKEGAKQKNTKYISY